MSLQRRRQSYFGLLFHGIASFLCKKYITHYGHTIGARAIRGRPRRKWIDGMHDDCSDLGLTLLEATRLAEDRRAWRPASVQLGLPRVATSTSLSGH